MLAGTLLLTVQDAVSKGLIRDFHAGEILFFRGLWAYLPIAWFAWRSGGWRALSSRRPGVNAVRALLNSAAGFAVISAYAFMPLADAMAIVFASPILVAALAGPVLGERVTGQRWTTIGAGFLGVLVILQPGTGAFRWAMVLPLAGAVFIAVRDLLTARLGAFDGTTVILFYTVSASVLAGAASMAAFGGHWPNGWQWGLFAGMGLVNGVAHFMAIRAFALAAAALLAPLRYLALVWAGVIGFAVWGDVPSGAPIAGAALVVASGLYIVFAERR